MATILIIDDEPDFLSNLAQMLEYESFTVITALDGEGAIPKATEQSVDLILCDMLMQTMSGFQILQAIRQNPKTARTPFVFVTAVKWDTEVETGASGYLIKPFTQAELLEVVHEQLSN